MHVLKIVAAGFLLILPCLLTPLLCSRIRDGGTIHLHTSVPIELVETMRVAFERDNPHIKVNVVRRGTRAIIDNIKDKAESGDSINADIVWVADFAAAQELKQKDLLQKYVSPEAAAIPPIFKDTEGYYAASRLLSMVVAYNTKHIKEKPTSYTDLLKPEYKGKVAIVDPGRSGSSLYTIETLLGDARYGWEFFYTLRNELSLAIVEKNDILAQRIAGGEYWIGIAIDFAVRTVLRDVPSLPLAYAFPADGVVAIPSPICITRDCSNLRSSKTFVDWILSQKGQRFMSDKLGITPVRLDVNVPEGMAKLDRLAIIPSDAREIVRRRAGSTKLIADIIDGKKLEQLNVDMWD